jgi:hypothetical protein
MLGAVEDAARWLDEHPAYIFDRIKCYVGEKPELGEDT